MTTVGDVFHDIFVDSNLFDDIIEPTRIPFASGETFMLTVLLDGVAYEIRIKQTSDSF